MEQIRRGFAEFFAAVNAARRANDPKDTIMERITDLKIEGAIPDRLKWPSHFSSDAELRNRRRADWQQVDPRIAEFAFRFMAVMAKEGVPFFVHSAYRTREQQNALVQKGASKTPWPRAAHCQGAAVDIVHSRYAWLLNPPEWDWIGIVGKQVHAQMMKQLPADQRWQITWGGDWKSFYDPAHWEIADWRGNVRIPVEAAPVIFDYSPKVAVRDAVWSRLLLSQ